jgi:hypothetical protein
MARPIALEACVSLSGPEHRLTAYDAHGEVVHHMDGHPWLSLDVHVAFLLDDERRVSSPEPEYALGGPLDCTREEFEERVRDLIFSVPRYLPGDRHAEPPKLVEDLAAHGIDSTIETLSRLPLTVLPDDEVSRHLRPEQ